MKWFKRKTYKVYCRCSNCLEDITIKIPMGIKAKGYQSACPNCGDGLKLGTPTEKVKE